MMRHIKAFMINTGINQTELEFIASSSERRKIWHITKGKQKRLSALTEPWLRQPYWRAVVLHIKVQKVFFFFFCIILYSSLHEPNRISSVAFWAHYHWLPLFLQGWILHISLFRSFSTKFTLKFGYLGLTENSALSCSNNGPRFKVFYRQHKAKELRFFLNLFFYVSSLIRHAHLHFL